MGPATPVAFVTHPGDGVWMESVVVDEGGTWYGYYHNEVPAALCGRLDRVLPRIGAARSRDNGDTWDDLGIILEAPPGWHDCATANQYFVGGVGDVSVLLDRESKDLYLYFSQYSKFPAAQGVALARLAWADRDAPVGRVTVFNDGAWLPANAVVERGRRGTHASRLALPVRHAAPAAPAQPWHDDDPGTDAFWGASVHWNVSLQLYVMLLNRTKDEQFTQEGVYVSFARRLDSPAAWTLPIKIVDGGSWYPQVMGIETRQRQRQAGRRTRAVLHGRPVELVHRVQRAGSARLCRGEAIPTRCDRVLLRLQALGELGQNGAVAGAGRRFDRAPSQPAPARRVLHAFLQLGLRVARADDQHRSWRAERVDHVVVIADSGLEPRLDEVGGEALREHDHGAGGVDPEADLRGSHASDHSIGVPALLSTRGPVERISRREPAGE